MIQDPVLFSGSLKMNIDPYNMHSDYDIWNALDQSHLKQLVLGLDKQLLFECSEGGENVRFFF